MKSTILTFLAIALPVMAAPQLSGGTFTCNVRSSCGTGPLPYRNAPRVASQVVGYYAPGTKLTLSCYSVTEPGGCGDSNVWYREGSRGVYVPAACMEGCTGGNSGGLRLC